MTLLAMLFTATSYSFMVKRFPVAGSAYSYTNLAFGPNVGFLAGWSLLLDYLFIPMINYLLIGLFLNIAFPAIPAWTIVLASIALVTVLNVVGIHSVAKASNLIVGAQIVFIGVFVALSYQSLAGQPVDLLSPLLGDGNQPGFGHLMAGAAVLCLSFPASMRSRRWPRKPVTPAATYPAQSSSPPLAPACCSPCWPISANWCCQAARSPMPMPRPTK